MELVSIVIPVYNMENEIENCVHSLLNQSYKNLEIILVDDGSKDNSYKRCIELSKKDNRIISIHTENQGSGPARNEGIKIASGKYVYFPDADDYVEKDAIEKLVNIIEITNSDLVVFGFRNIDINGKLLSEKKYKFKTEEAANIRNHYKKYYTMWEDYTMQGAPWNKFFDLTVIKKFKIFYPSLRRHQDEGFIARYVDKASRITFSNEILYTYYVNNLQKQWDKYPVDYIEAVNGLFNERKKNILLWNKNDKATHQEVYIEYICNFIKALELSFSPKFKFNTFERMHWIQSKVKYYKFTNIKFPKGLGKYQSFIKTLIDNQLWVIMYIMMKVKISIEKNIVLRKE